VHDPCYIKAKEKTMARTAKAAGAPVVTAIFRTPEQVESAYQAAVEHGYTIGDVNVVMSEDTRRRLYTEQPEHASEIGKKAAEGAELGGPTGGRVGIAITIGAAVAAAAVLPGLGLVAAGPIAVALAGAGAAGLAAALVTAAADWGLPEDRTRLYETEIGDGAILIGVTTRNDEDASAIARSWEQLGARLLFR
jgi:hypothetical protein